MATARSPVRKLYKGNPVSPGVGMGRSCFCRASSNNYLAVANSFKSNNQQVKAAFVQLSKKLTTLIQISENKADENLAALFKAHKMICNELEVEVIETINKKQTTAIDAIEECFSFYADHFSLSDNNYFKGRADDFSELKKLLLAFIQNSRDMLECREYSGCEMGECALGNEHILITDELSANVVIRVSTNTKGIISDKGNKNCHAAVVARSLGIPVVSGIKTIDSSFAYEDVVLINGGGR